MATNFQGRVGSTTDSERKPGREIETIVEEFSGDPVLLLDTTAKAPADASLTPRTKSSLAKKFAKTLGFHSHSKDSASESSSLSTNSGSQLQGQQASPGAKVQTDRGVHFISSTQSGSSVTGNGPSANLASISQADSSSNVVNKQPAPSSSSHATYVSPFQSAQHQPSGVLTEASAFYSPTSSFNSIGSGKRAMSASLDDDGSQMRKSRLAPGNFHSYSGDLEQMKPKLGLLEQAPADERSASGMLSGKSRRSSAISLKSMDGASDSDKDLNALARANAENPWGPKRSVGSFTSGVSGRARGDQSPRLRGAYAEIQIKDMDQQLSDARMRIVQLTAEVQSSKQAAQHHEERTAALQAQLGELKQVKNSSSQDILERLSSARSEASSLSEQLAVAKHQAEAEHKENLKLQKAMSEQGSARQQAVDAKQKELDTQQAAARAAQEKLQQQVAQLTQQCNSYEVVLKNGDTKGQLMSLQQSLRQEIHAKIGAQTAEESAKRKVSDLQGSVQELQEALDKEVASHKKSQSTLEEAYRHRNSLEARIDELEAHMTDGAEATSGVPPQVVSKSPDPATPDGSVTSEVVAARLTEVGSRERDIKEQRGQDQEEKGRETKQQETLRLKVEELEKELMEANKRLTRIDEDKRLVGSQAIKPEPSAQPAPGHAPQADPKPQTAPTETLAAPAKQITSWRRISVDDDRVDAVISHLEGVNTTLKSLRSQGDDLEPFMGSEQDLVSELENERTNRVIAQQTANQERLQARASAAESASLRRQLNELNQQMEQEKRATAAARLQSQQTQSSQGEKGVKQEAAARTYSMSSEGHAADKAALQGFAKTRDAASSPVRPAIDQQQSSKVDEGVQTKESEVSHASPASQQQSEVANPSAEGGDPTEPHSTLPGGHGMEKNYTDTIESLLSELWKERLARQRAELSATESEDKLKVLVSAAEAHGGEGRRGSSGGQEGQAKAMADLDASLMQRLDEDSATNHKLMESLKATQGSSQALQERVAGVEAALRRQDSALDKLQAGAKRHMDASLRQGTTRKTLQQATQKEDKLRHTLTRVEAELAATRRLQRDQAAHAHSSARQLGDEVLEGQAQLSQQGARLAKETARRCHLEALLDEGLQVQSQILLGLQEMVRYLQQDGHLEGQEGQGGVVVSPPPKLDQLILLLQQSQANSSNAMSRSGSRQGVGRQSSPTRIRSAPSQKGHFSLSGTLEEGTPPVELSSSPPGTGTFSRPAWLVPGSRTEQRAAVRREGEKRSSSPFGSTAARYMNPRAAAKPATEPDRMFRARSVPRGMSPQRSRVADYIRIGSPVHRGNSTQVLPATSSDMMSRERDFISAQHDPTLISSNQQLSGNLDSTIKAKPASLLSLDNGGAASELGSFSSYDKVQVVSSHASTAQAQHLRSSEAGKWGPQSMMHSIDGPQRLAGMLGPNDRHTHED